MKYFLQKFLRYFVGKSFYFFINLINEFAFPSHENWLVYVMFAASCINTTIDSSILLNLAFLHEILLVSLHLGHLVNVSLNFLFQRIRTFPVIICRWSLSVKPKLPQLHGKMVQSWRKALISTLKRNLLKLNISNLLGVCNRTIIKFNINSSLSLSISINEYRISCFLKFVYS